MNHCLTLGLPFMIIQNAKLPAKLLLCSLLINHKFPILINPFLIYHFADIASPMNLLTLILFLISASVMEHRSSSMKIVFHNGL